MAEPRSVDMPTSLLHDASREIGSPIITNYTPKDYNAHPQNWNIVQDHRGVMYFANGSGVLEFDGASWRLIELPNTPEVRSLAIGPDNILYVGSNDELGYVAMNPNGNPQYVSLVEKIPKEHRVFGYVYAVHATKQGIVFSAYKKLLIWNGRTMQVIPFEDIGSWIAYPVHGRIFVLDIAGNTGIYELQAGRRKLLPFLEPIAAKRTIALLPVPDGKMLMVTRSGELYLYDLSVLDKDHSDVEAPQALQPITSPTKAYLGANSVYFNPIRAGDHYIFNTLQGGVVMVDLDFRLHRIINKNRGLLENRVWSVFVDRNHNLWAAMNKGIAYIQISSPLSIFNALNGMESVVLRFARHENKLYAAAFDGIHVLEPHMMQTQGDNTAFRHLHTASDCFAFIKKNESLFFAPIRSGLYQVLHGRVDRLIEKTDFLIMDSAESKRYPRHVFAGLLQGGLAVLEFETQMHRIRFKRLYRNVIPEPKEMVWSIKADHRGNLWLQTTKGIFQIVFTGDNFDQYDLYRYEPKEMQLSGNSLFIFDTTCLVGSDKGLMQIVLDESDYRRAWFKPATYLAGSRVERHQDIRRVLAHSEDTLVVVSDDGMVLLAKQDDGGFAWNASALKKIQGLPSGASIDVDGVIWIGTPAGVYRYDLDIKKNYHAIYHTLIRRVSIGNQSRLLDGNYYEESSGREGRYLVSSLQQPDSLKPVLSYAQNSVAFRYAATFYENPESMRYQYMLKGYDATWSDWTEKTEKEYTNLPEGTYRFEVRARNIFDQQGLPAGYDFSVLPPWYRTILAYGGYLLVFALTMYIGIRINNRRLIAAKKRLEKIVSERTEQVRKQKDQLEIKNHEINAAYLKLKSTQNQLLDASWRAGMADVASNVIHNVGNALNSVMTSQNILQDKITQSRIANLGKTSEILKNPKDINPISSRGASAIEYSSLLANQLQREHADNLKELYQLGESLRRVNSIIASQQKYTQINGIEDDITPEELVNMALAMSKLSNQEEIRIYFSYLYNEALHIQRHKVIQIIINLLHNAKKSLDLSDRMDKSIRISVSELDAERMQIEVADNGKGLDQEALSRVFSFEVSDSSVQDLDLHASANAAKSIGGRLYAASEGLDRGCSLVLELPKAGSAIR